MLESTVAIPFLLFVTFTCVDLGIVFKKWDTLSHDMAEGSRRSVALLSDTSQISCNAYTSLVEESIHRYLIAKNPDLLRNRKIDFKIDKITPYLDPQTSKTIIEVKSSINFLHLTQMYHNFFPDIEVNDAPRLRHSGRYLVEGNKLTCINQPNNTPHQT